MKRAKDVKDVKTLPQNKSFYLTIYSLLGQGKNPSQISKQLGISRQRVYYYTRLLKKRGNISKKGYGTWEIKDVKTLTLRTPPKRCKNIRGHAFIWRVKIEKNIDWISRLEKAKIDYKLVRHYIPRIFVGRKKVWLGKKSIVIYEPFSFYGENAVESRKHAVISLLETLGEIENKFRVNLKPYTFKVSREHYAMIKNELASQVNREGEKIRVSDENGEWLWIDMSDGVGELETGNFKAMENSLGVQKWYNDMKKHNFEVTSSFVLNGFSRMLQAHELHAENIIKHQRVLDEMSETLKQIRDKLK